MTKYLLLNARTYDHPPTKKPKGAAVTSEVHITVNITPVRDASSALQGSYIMTTNLTIQSSSAPASGPLHSNAPCTPRPSATLVLLDCINEQCVPTINDLLSLFEHKKPTINTAEVLNELENFVIRDVVDLYSLQVELLALFGGLGKDGSQCLQLFVLERLLGSLGLMDTQLFNSDDDSMQEVTTEGVAIPVVTEGVTALVVTEEVTAPVVTERVTASPVLQQFDGVGEGKKKVDEFDEGSDSTCVDEEP